MRSAFLTSLLFATAYATPLDASQQESCIPCAPQGATGSVPPAVGVRLDTLFLDVLESVKDIHFRKRWIDAITPREDGFCCRETLECINVQNLNIPMCYDKFTTNFAFQDGSWGSLTTGEYNAQGGAKVNLISGQYTVQGLDGNIYSEDPAAKPDTATLSIPPQWTETGVGSAIPASEIASVVPITSTAASALTTPATTPSATGLNTNGNNAPANTASPSSVASTGAAVQTVAESSMSLGMSIFTAIIYVFYSL
jgi:hypothetical protein